jgi:GNAT superfamily N-acetyltransferase
MSIGEQGFKAVHLHEIALNPSERELAKARELLLEYGRFVIAQPGAARFCFGALESEAARLPLSYQEKGGGCILATFEGEPAGFVAWRALEPSAEILLKAWELKRIWVRPIARGLGLGRALVIAVLERAVAAGRKAIYLDTAPASMVAAQRIYLELGFLPCVLPTTTIR